MCFRGATTVLTLTCQQCGVDCDSLLSTCPKCGHQLPKIPKTLNELQKSINFENKSSNHIQCNLKAPGDCRLHIKEIGEQKEEI